MAEPERMPPIPAGELSAEQRAAAAELLAGRRGELTGPFVPLLRSPELLRRLQRTGEYLRYDSALEPRLSEFAILVIARQWSQPVEWALHHEVALAAGVGAGICAALAEGRRPPGMDARTEAVYDVLDELWRVRTVSGPTYRRAVGLLGERGLVDLIGIAGYYGLLAMLMNATRTAPPAGTGPALPALP